MVFPTLYSSHNLHLLFSWSHTTSSLCPSKEPCPTAGVMTLSLQTLSTAPHFYLCTLQVLNTVTTFSSQLWPGRLVPEHLGLCCHHCSTQTDAALYFWLINIGVSEQGLSPIKDTQHKLFLLCFLTNSFLQISLNKACSSQESTCNGKQPISAALQCYLPMWAKGKHTPVA